MIKYYCDMCGKEINSVDLIQIKIRCHKLVGIRDVVKVMHKNCAVEFIGKEYVEAEEKRKAEQQERWEKIKNERLKVAGVKE